MTRRRVALPWILTALLIPAVLPASAQGAREQTSSIDLVDLLQSDDATAEQLQAALARVEEILGFQPPPCESGQDRMFNDVPASNPFCPFIEEMARRGITAGCGDGNFCPGDPVTRFQMATFIVKTLGEAAWHEVGTPGEPEFGFPDPGFECVWGNFDADHSSAAFFRDGAGFVHLKGVVQVDGVGSSCQEFFDFLQPRTIFILPEGFRPQRKGIFVTLTNGQLGRVTVHAGPSTSPEGLVSVDPPTTFENADQWVSLDGISFRCDPEEPGCP
ncbi:MAG: S-layer homology domain-containing protein [Thermoanaerobaculia bacterium]